VSRRPPTESQRPRADAGTSPGIERRRTRLEILLVVLLAALPFLSVSDGPFLYDDRLYVLENHQVTEAGHTLQCLTTSYPPGGATQALYRPLVTLSFALDHALAGLEATVFHLTNVLLHVGASLAAYFLLRAWLPALAGWSAMLFAVHPVHTEAVSWIVGRAELLCGLFLFLALRLAPRRFVVASALLFLALASKEMAITGPLLVLLPVVFLGAPPAPSRRAFVGFTLALLLYLGLRASVLGWLTPQGDDRLLLEASLLERLPSMFVAYAEYVRLSFLPLGLAVDHAWETTPTWRDPLAGLGLVLVIGSSAVAWGLRRRLPWLSVAVAWFFLALLPVSHLFPIGATYAERFLYIPSLGACLALAALLDRIRSRRLGACALALLVLVGVGLTLHRNQDWRDEERFYSAALAASPHNSTLWNNLGRFHAEKGRLDVAETNFQEALRWKPDHPPALCNLGVLRAMAGRLAEARDLIERSLQADPGYARGYSNLGKVDALEGRVDEARRAFERALELNPGYEEARRELELLPPRAR
jgi:protein O-mannosyl-transferase